jgi:putative ATP-binding cassette transporter
MQIQSAVGRVRDAWRLAKPYWKSEERWSAWALPLGVITLNLGNVYISVRINEWNKAFYNALQAFNGAAFFRQLSIFGILVAAAIAMSVYALYLKQMLQIRWRRWLPRKYLAAWLADRAYYQLQLGGTTDNPDQRISEDLDQFTAYVMNLSVSFISSAVSLSSFLVILWGLSGPAEIPLGKWGTLHIHAYLD